MIEVLKNIIDLVINFIQYCFNFKIDISGNQVPILTLAISFTAVILILSFILKYVFGKGDD